MSEYFSTRQGVWQPLRTAVTADDTALDGTTSGATYAFGDKPDAAVKLAASANGVELFFYGTAAANKTANYKIYAYRGNGPARLICAGVVTTGAAVTGATNTFYCDTITIITNNNDCSVIDSGNDRAAILYLGDMRGYSWLHCEVDIVAGQIVALSSKYSSF